MIITCTYYESLSRNFVEFEGFQGQLFYHSFDCVWVEPRPPGYNNNKAANIQVNTEH